MSGGGSEATPLRRRWIHKQAVHNAVRPDWLRAGSSESEVAPLAPKAHFWLRQAGLRPSGGWEARSARATGHYSLL